MKLYYLATAERIKEIPHECHWLDIDENTHHLVCVNWRDELHEAEWAAREGVIALPHPLFGHTERLTNEHVAHLAKKFPVTTEDTIHGLLKHVSKIDLWMRCHAL